MKNCCTREARKIRGISHPQKNVTLEVHNYGLILHTLNKKCSCQVRLHTHECAFIDVPCKRWLSMKNQRFLNTLQSTLYCRRMLKWCLLRERGCNFLVLKILFKDTGKSNINKNLNKQISLYKYIHKTTVN